MAEDVVETAADNSEVGLDIAPPEANGWWKFETKDSAVDWVNDKIEKRLAREKSKYAPILTERDMLKTRVAELEPFEEAKKTDTQRWESERENLTKELEDLRQFQKRATRDNLVREIADDKGLPTRFISRVHGEDAESITADIEELLTVLNDGKSTKPPSRQPKSPEDKAPTKGHGGGGGDEETVDADVIMKRLRDKNGGRGHNPFSLRR